MLATAGNAIIIESCGEAYSGSVAMTWTHAASVIAIGSAVLLFGQLDAAAKSGTAKSGIAKRGAHTSHGLLGPFKGLPRAHHRKGFRGYPDVAILSSSPYDVWSNRNGGDLPPTLAVPPPPPYELSCERSHETVTVVSDDGGTRAIKVTRC
jgi:hypothetical protein